MLRIQKLFCFILLSFSFTALYGQSNSTDHLIKGYWEGAFPIGPDIKVLLYFEKDENYIRLYDGLDKISEDNINDYSFGDDSLSFRVRSAQADINALVKDNEINAKMKFADGNEVSFGCLKVETPFFVRDAHKVIDPFTHLYSPEELAEDLQFLVDTLKKYQPNLYTLSSSNFLEKKLNSIKAELNEGKKELEFLRMITTFTEKVGCGHLGVGPSQRIMSRQQEVKLFPLRIKFIGSKVFISECYAENIILESGIELLSINGKGIDEIVKILFDGISSDGRNLSTKKAIIENYMPSLYASHLELADEYFIEYRSSGETEIKTAIIKGISPGELMNTFYAKHTDKNPGAFPIRTKNLGDGTAYIKLNQFYYKDFNRYSEFFASLFQEYKSQQITNLILDLRGNGGGRPEFSFKMLSMIADGDFQYFSRNARLEKYYSELMDVQEKSPYSF